MTSRPASDARPVEAHTPTPFCAGAPFPQVISGPDVSLHTVYPVIERGQGTLRVRALAVSADAQESIVRAVNAHDDLVGALKLAQPELKAAIQQFEFREGRKPDSTVRALAVIDAALAKAGSVS